MLLIEEVSFAQHSFTAMKQGCRGGANDQQLFGEAEQPTHVRTFMMSTEGVRVASFLLSFSMLIRGYLSACETIYNACKVNQEGVPRIYYD